MRQICAALYDSLQTDCACTFSQTQTSDCVSFKPNSTNVFVQGLDCLTLPGGSGGISVGSLGQYPGVLDIVENVLVDNCTIRQSESGARIKAWPSEKIDAPFHAKGGGGLGVVRDITYSNILLDNVTLALDIRTCYGVSNQSLCASKKVCFIEARAWKCMTRKELTIDPLVASPVSQSSRSRSPTSTARRAKQRHHTQAPSRVQPTIRATVSPSPDST